MAVKIGLQIRDTQKLEAAQMRFLKPVLDHTKFSHQSNPDIHNRLKVNNLIEDTKLYPRNWLDHVDRMDRAHLPKLAFQYKPRVQQEVGRPKKRWKDQEDIEL
jgi:hypothetical protein